MEFTVNGQPKNVGRFGSFIFFFIFLLVGGLLAFFTLSWITDGLESKNWPNVEGTIISSEFISSRNSENKPMYGAEILYEYYINDVKYIGNGVTSGGQSSSSNPGSAQRLANKYNEGEKANVYYNPEDPELALLEPGFHATDALPFSIGILFALIGLGGVLYSLFGDFSKYQKTN